VNPGKRKAPEGTGADATTKHHQPESYNTSFGHEGYMRLLGDRVRWLERHRHWWLRTEVGRLQREFIERRDAA
jgi:hypothetical protein